MTTTLLLLQGLMIFVLVGIGNNLFVEMLSMDVLPSSSSSNSLLLHQRSSSSSSALRRRSIRRRDRSNSHQIISMTTTMMMMISGDDDADYADPDDDDVNRDRDDDEEEVESSSKENENEPLAKAVIKMDDGGSDLTNRFKYKVNALMGKFDPPPGNDDNERQDGNILNAMLKFPVRYTFNVVGKVSGGNNDDDDNNNDDYVEQVKKVILDISGDDNGMICKIIPRGTKFVKLNIEVEVLSTTMINTIYEDIGKLDNTVMKF